MSEKFPKNEKKKCLHNLEALILMQLQRINFLLEHQLILKNLAI